MTVGRFQDAEEKYCRAIDADRSIADAFVGLGALRRQQRRYKEAICACEQAEKIDPYHPGPLRVWADSLRDWASEQAKRNDSCHPPGQLRVGADSLRERCNDYYDRAIDKYGALPELDLYQVSAYVRWGELLLRKREPREAISKLK